MNIMSTHIIVNDLSKKLNLINNEKLTQIEIERKVNKLFDECVSTIHENFEPNYANEIIIEARDFKNAILSSLLEDDNCIFFKS